MMILQIVDIFWIALGYGDYYRHWFFVILGIVFIITCLVAFAVILAVHGAISLKYQYYLKQLVNALKNEDIEHSTTVSLADIVNYEITANQESPLLPIISTLDDNSIMIINIMILI